MPMAGLMFWDESFSPRDNFLNGQVILIDKPYSWTSFQVVNKVRYLIRYACNVKKIKVGHAGTLDPLATGLLVLCTGKKTKEIESYQQSNKVYTGKIVVGATRPSFDRETEIDHTFETSHLSEELILQAARELLGERKQIPPTFSAKKVNGVRAYKHARRGTEVVMRSHTIHVHTFDILSIEGTTISFQTKVSKGTYIRSLAHELGQILENGAYLSELKRTQSGSFDLKDSLTIENFEKQLAEVIQR
jgi:tRNA pseudouridine55 synthase